MTSNRDLTNTEQIITLLGQWLSNTGSLSLLERLCQKIGAAVLSELNNPIRPSPGKFVRDARFGEGLGTYLKAEDVTEQKHRASLTSFIN